MTTIYQHNQKFDRLIDTIITAIINGMWDGETGQAREWTNYPHNGMDVCVRPIKAGVRTITINESGRKNPLAIGFDKSLSVVSVVGATPSEYNAIVYAFAHIEQFA